MIERTIRNITKDSFMRYGAVMEFSPDYKERFEIIVKETEAGWRLAVYRFNDRATTVMENHPASMESFEPLQGTALLLVAENGSPSNYEAFLLDKPVCLYKGVWHQVLSLSEEACVKITENSEVTTEFFHFENEIKVLVIS
jgi:ureidoglycolate hydrolase